MEDRAPTGEADGRDQSQFQVISQSCEGLPGPCLELGVSCRDGVLLLAALRNLSALGYYPRSPQQARAVK